MQLAALDYSFQVHLLPLVRALSDGGFDVVCCGPGGPFTRELRDAGLRYVEVPFARTLNAARHLASLARLVRVVRAERVDLLHSHTAIAGLLGRVAARMAGVRAVAHTAHGFPFHPGMPPARRRLLESCERLGMRFTDHMFVQTEEDRRLAAGWGVLPEHRIQNIGNGIDLTRFDAAAVPPAALAALRSELDLPPGATVVTYIARPTAAKGAPELREMAARLAARHRDVHFVCVVPELPGEAGGARHLFAAGAGKERLRVLGFRRDIPAILALSDVFVLPTLHEGLCKSIIEAMAMGVPVVTSDVRGCRELVEEGRTGHRVPAGDVAALTARVDALLREPERRRALGERARRVVLERFDQRVMLNAQVEALRSLLARRTAGR